MTEIEKAEENSTDEDNISLGDDYSLTASLASSHNELEIAVSPNIKHANHHHTLKYPPGFIKRHNIPSLTTTTHSNANKNLDLDSRLNGFPGGLELTKDKTMNYFGMESRNIFNDRIRWLNNQRCISGVDPEMPSTHLVFDSTNNMKPNQNISDSNPFSPVRQTKPSVKLSTKIIIRNHALNTESYSQSKLVAISPEKLMRHSIPFEELSEVMFSSPEGKAEAEKYHKFLQERKALMDSSNVFSRQLTNKMQLKNYETELFDPAIRDGRKTAHHQVLPGPLSIGIHDPSEVGRPVITTQQPSEKVSGTTTITHLRRRSSISPGTSESNLNRLNYLEVVHIDEMIADHNIDTVHIFRSRSSQSSASTVSPSHSSTQPPHLTPTANTVPSPMRSVQKVQILCDNPYRNGKIVTIGDPIAMPTSPLIPLPTFQLPTHFPTFNKNSSSKSLPSKPNNHPSSSMSNPSLAVDAVSRFDMDTAKIDLTYDKNLTQIKRSIVHHVREDENEEKVRKSIPASKKKVMLLEKVTSSHPTTGPLKRTPDSNEKSRKPSEDNSQLSKNKLKRESKPVVNERKSSKATGNSLPTKAPLHAPLPSAQTAVASSHIKQPVHALNSGVHLNPIMAITNQFYKNHSPIHKHDHDTLAVHEIDSPVDAVQTVSQHLDEVLSHAAGHLVGDPVQEFHPTVERKASSKVSSDGAKPPSSRSGRKQQQATSEESFNQPVTTSQLALEYDEYRRVLQLEETFDKHPIVEPLHLVYIDKRDEFSRRVQNVQKSSSLYQYIQSKRLNFEMNSDSSSESEDDDMTYQLALLDTNHPAAGPAVRKGNKTRLNNRHLHQASEMMSGSLALVSMHSPPSDPPSASSLNASLDAVGEEIISPRSKYIDECIRKKMNPRTSLILRKTFTKRMNLSHYGMGDEMAITFANAIKDVPYIESLNIDDNNLNDKGLAPVLKSIMNMKDLVELNISYNTIQPESAAALAEYLSFPSCPLERLIMRRSDVDDGECERFVTALLSNVSLTELDLAQNMIGSAENLNTVMPDVKTGGEALGDLLRTPTCALKTLKLGWNMIRLSGAEDLMESLKHNKTLTHMDLSYNSLGTNGGKALGDALQENKTLRHLLIANNNIDSVACMTICAGILENDCIENVVFDGNPIGEEGAKALMLLPTMIGGRVRISLHGCNITIRDPKCWFDSSHILRKYDCRLDNSFDRAVALFLLNLVPSHNTYAIATSEWIDPTGRLSTNLHLTQVSAPNKIFDEKQWMVVNKLQLLHEASSDRIKAIELFNQVDEDHSGKLDEEEFSILLIGLGIDCESSGLTVSDIMEEYDIDKEGTIGIDEFLLFLRKQTKHAQKRIKELTEIPVLAAQSEPHAIGEHLNKTRYIPPRSGVLRMSVIDTFTQKDAHRVISDSDRKFIDDIAKQSGDKMTMTAYGVQNYKIRIDEAIRLVDTMLEETNNKIFILSKVLPQMESCAESRMLVFRVLGNVKIEIMRLKREIGYAFRPIMGSCDGYYVLDLSKEMDKFCLHKLIEVGMTKAHFRSKKSKLGYGVLGDLSQKGNWSCFRNEMYNGRAVTLTAEFASPMPKSGKLEFDFVSERRWSPDDFALSDVRFVNVLVKQFQLQAKERVVAVKRLDQVRRQSEKTIYGDAVTVYECPEKRSRLIGFCMKEFYDNLSHRHVQVEENKHFESIRVPLPDLSDIRFQTIDEYVDIPSILSLHIISNKKDLKFSSTSTANSPSNHMVTLIAAGGGGSTDSLGKASHGQSGSGGNKHQQLLKSVTERLGRGGGGGGGGEDSTTSTRRGAITIHGERNKSLEMIKEEFRSDYEYYFGQCQSYWKEVVTVGPDEGRRLFGDVNKRSGGGGHDLTLSIGPLGGGIGVGQVEDMPQAAQYVTEFIDEEKVHHTENLPDIPSDTIRYLRVLASNNVHSAAKASRTLDILLEAFENTYIMARHLELLCLLFRDIGTTKTSDHFGTYRVELVVGLFSSVIDIHNFEIVARALNPFEMACVYCRIGWLHLYNPMKPEGSYELELGRREERMVMKTLCQLAVAEPGDNLPYLQFRWDRDMDPMPGFELTEPWLTEEGLPSKGIINCTYYSGEGVGSKGCKPIIKLRKSFVQLVLVEEEEMVVEKVMFSESNQLTPQNRSKDFKTVGEQFMLANLGIWWGYLCYNETEFQNHSKSRNGNKESSSANDDKKKKK